MTARRSAQVKVPSTYVHRHFQELTQRVYAGQEHFVVEKEGMAVMAILSISEYDELMKEREENEKNRAQRLKRFQEAARRIGEKIEELGLTEEELDAQIEAARQEYHTKRQHGTTQK